MVARVIGRGWICVCQRARTPAAFAILSFLIAALPAELSWAKVPGTVHCYRKVCHRVKTLGETERMVGRTISLATSYYDDPKVDRYNVGLLTSSGERFDAGNAARAASSIFPDGTELMVWNPNNGRAAHVRVNDFGPFHTDRTLDITRGLAERLGLIRRGVAKLRVTVIAAPPPREPRYRAFRTYPETKGYLGTFEEMDAAALAVDLVKEARSLNPPLPTRAPRLVRATPPQPKPWHRPARETVPTEVLALVSAPPRVSIPIVSEVSEVRTASDAIDGLDFVVVPQSVVAAVEAVPSAPANQSMSRLHFASVILSAPTPAAATLEPPADHRQERDGPVTALSYLLAGIMLGFVSLLIGVVTHPMRRSTRPTIVVDASKGLADASATATQSVTVIGANLHVKGDVSSSGDVVIEGHLEGNCRCRRLRVAATGRLTGDVHADELIIEGSIAGTVMANSVRADGQAAIEGEVRYGELAVARDAQVNAVCRLRPRPAKPHSVAGELGLLEAA